MMDLTYFTRAQLALEEHGASAIVCGRCGGDSVEMVMWADANREVVTDDAGVRLDSDSEAYCNDCAMHGTLVFACDLFPVPDDRTLRIASQEDTY